MERVKNRNPVYDALNLSIEFLDDWKLGIESTLGLHRLKGVINNEYHKGNLSTKEFTRLREKVNARLN